MLLNDCPNQVQILRPRMFLEETLQSLFSNPTFPNPFRLCLSGGNTIENPEDNCLRHQCSSNLVLAQGQFAAFATAHWMLRALPGKTEPQTSPRICSKSLGYQGFLLTGCHGVPFASLRTGLAQALSTGMPQIHSCGVCRWCCRGLPTI